MIISRRNFPSILEDNLMLYFKYLQAAIEGVDGDASLLITCKIQGYHFRIVPSGKVDYNLIVDQLNDLHNRFGIKVVYSKSMKTSFNISFTIDL